MPKHPDLHGPGKYDSACSLAREMTGARGTLLIVIDGRDGSGFSVQAELDIIENVPEILERVARNIRAQRRRSTH